MVILGFIGSIIGFFGFLFLLALAIVVIAGVAIRNYISRLFGGDRFASDNRRYEYDRSRDNAHSEKYENDGHKNSGSKRNGNKRGKIFGKDEGKYVDFVEVKD